MNQQHDEMTFSDKVQAFLNQLEIARLEIGGLANDIVRINVDEFCQRVASAVQSCIESKPVDETTIHGTMEIKAPVDMCHHLVGHVFMVVERVERGLFTANTAFGLTFTFIATHFQHSFKLPNIYSFSWKIMFKDIREPLKYPTVESVRRDIEWRRCLMVNDYRDTCP